MLQHPEAWYAKRGNNRAALYGVAACCAAGAVLVTVFSGGAWLSYLLRVVMCLGVVLSVYDTEELGIGHKAWRGWYSSFGFLAALVGPAMLISDPALTSVVVSSVVCIYLVLAAVTSKSLASKPRHYSALFDILDARSPRRF